MRVDNELRDLTPEKQGSETATLCTSMTRRPGRTNVAGAGCAGATEVEWSEKDMGGAVAEWMLELVDHQPIAVDTQPLQGDGPSGNVTTNAL